MKTIRAGRGLGDSLYLQSVARHLLDHGHDRLEVRSDYPEVFRPLGGRVTVQPFSRVGVDILAHYTSRKGIAGSTQFEDCCRCAGIAGPVDLRLDWQPLEPPLVQSEKPVVLVQLPRAPMGRTDGFGAELLPDCRALQHVIDGLSGKALLVQVGSGEPLFRFERIDVDLANKTTVSQLLDLASGAAAFVGYCSFFVPLAESFSKQALFVWSQRGLRTGQLFVRQITPQKVLHKPSSRWLFDDAPAEALRECAHALLQLG